MMFAEIKQWKNNTHDLVNCGTLSNTLGKAFGDPENYIKIVEKIIAGGIFLIYFP